MKNLRLPLAALFSAFLLAVTSFAADISGPWQWMMQNRSGPQEVHATFSLKDGVLTGTVSGRMGEAPIGDASITDGQVRFTVTREVNGEKIVIKYAGKLEGDTITGTIERPGFNEHDASMILEWKASRAN
jgi:hypothetical protein